MRIIALASLAFAAVSGTDIALAQAYPSRPITIICPFPGGSPVDTIARIVSERMKVSLGQPFVIENVTGAGGTIGVARAARAAPDGYTVSLGNFSSHVIAGAVYPVQYDVLKDLDPVALLASNPQIIVSTNALPARGLQDLVAWLRANPGKASAGTAGPGSISHVAGVFFQKATNTQFQFVPYRGVNQAQLDLIGGRIDLMFDQAASAVPSVRAGKVTAHAVTSRSRLPSAPDIPTVEEAGMPGLVMSVWSALWLPKGTPKDIIAKFNAAAMEAIADPTVRNRLNEFGLDVPPNDQQTPEALATLHKSEIEKWWPIVKAASIKID
jgi:tripartite-type tricarboxylate transporter receptor subunit TctC